MDIDRIIELLEIEHECITRGATCDRNCAACDLVQKDEDLHEMYSTVINIMKNLNKIN